MANAILPHAGISASLDDDAFLVSNASISQPEQPPDFAPSIVPVQVNEIDVRELRLIGDVSSDERPRAATNTLQRLAAGMGLPSSARVGLPPKECGRSVHRQRTPQTEIGKPGERSPNKKRSRPQLGPGWDASTVERILAAARSSRGTVGGVPTSRLMPAIILIAIDSGCSMSLLLQLSKSAFDAKRGILGVEIESHWRSVVAPLARAVEVTDTAAGKLLKFPLHPLTITALDDLQNAVEAAARKTDLLLAWSQTYASVLLRIRDVLFRADVSTDGGRIVKRLQSVLCDAPTLLDDVDPNAACPVRVTGPVFSKKRAARPQPQKPVLNGRSTGHSGHVRTLPLLAESGETLRAPIVDKSEAEPLLFLGEVSSDARPQRVNGHGPRPLLDPGVPDLNPHAAVLEDQASPTSPRRDATVHSDAGPPAAGSQSADALVSAVIGRLAEMFAGYIANSQIGAAHRPPGSLASMGGRFSANQFFAGAAESVSLRGAYTAYLALGQNDNSVSNRKKFDTVLRAWERYMGDGSANSGPPIGEVTRETLRAFRDSLMRLQMSPFTINSYLGYVHQIIRRCGPADGYRNQEGCGILPHVPRAKRLQTPGLQPPGRSLRPARPLVRRLRSCDLAEEHHVARASMVADIALLGRNLRFSHPRPRSLWQAGRGPVLGFRVLHARVPDRRYGRAGRRIVPGQQGRLAQICAA